MQQTPYKEQELVITEWVKLPQPKTFTDWDVSNVELIVLPSLKRLVLAVESELVKMSEQEYNSLLEGVNYMGLMVADFKEGKLHVVDPTTGQTAISDEE